MITFSLTMLATVAAGLMAGLYVAFSIAVMPGLREMDDRTFIATMQAINRRILNPWFMAIFLGSVLAPVALAVTLLVGDHEADVRRWGVLGAVLAVVSFAITVGANVPRNVALDHAGDPSALADPAAVRGTFEASWTRWNHLRSVFSVAAFVALVIGAIGEIE